MATDYQNQVNNLSGAMGPIGDAVWPKVGPQFDNIGSMSQQPLYINSNGIYEPAYDMNASKFNINTYGSHKRHKKSYKKHKKSSKKNKFSKHKKHSKKLSKKFKNMQRIIKNLKRAKKI